MNVKTKIALVAALPLLWGCSTEHDFRVPATEGEEAVFVVGTRSTRTMYANDQWDAATNQELYWGNYLDGEEEYIRAFCGQGANKVGTYKINLKADPEKEQGSPVAGEVVRQGNAGVQWGADGTAHTFYAFYPASNVGETLGADGKTVSATILPGQSPKAFRAVVGDDAAVYEGAGSLTQVAANNKQDAASRTDIFCQPDMQNAAMVARTDMSADQFGQEVPLDFNVIADVLDITVNGPVIPNQLGGNAAGDSRPYILIYDVSVVHKDKKPIVGTFDLDMSNSTATNMRNGSDRILIQLAQTDGSKRQVPTLFARVNKSAGEKPDAATEVDHLRVRAFLAPGVVKNLNELQIVVSTDCGDYTQELGDYTITQGDQPNGTGNAGDPTMVAGKIHRLKLGYFMERGKSFDYERWMSQLDPTIYINELSIPGTWHSTDADYQGTGNTTIVDQYKKGIRAFETHASCSLDAPTLTNETAGTPTTSVNHQNGDPQPATSADDHDPTGRNQTRNVIRTVTYTQTITTPITATVSKANYKVTNSAGNDMFIGLSNLGAAILDTEFAVVEIGSPGSDKVNEPVVGSTATATRTQTKTITKTETGTQTSSGAFGYYYWNNTVWNYGSDPTNAEWAAVTATDGTTTDFKYAQTKSINSFVGGISWLINELKNAEKSKLYTAGVTQNTTINDVKGHFIIKVNTNYENGVQDTETGWGTNIPALFSRWTPGNASQATAIALRWGAPIAPDATSTLRWVFSELDNVGSDITVRQTAWTDYVGKSLDAYQSDDHNSWFEYSAGGYLNGTKTAANCQSMAKTMNSWLVDKITDPTRQECPLGLVFFNYALGSNSTYSGESLIRTIINNNAAFPLRRAGTKSVRDENNSYFRNEPNSPIQ